VLAALSAILNPNNSNPSLPFTDNVSVEQHGSAYTFIFRGAFAGVQIAYLESHFTGSQCVNGVCNVLPTSAASLTTPTGGIVYYNVDNLDIELGSGGDDFNVQGTAAGTTTQLDTNGGSDHVFVSDQANAVAGTGLDHLTGTLGSILGTLNIDEGADTAPGQSLLISDEGDAAARTFTLSDGVVSGLAPATINYTASHGDFSGGITVWSGFGDDTATVKSVQTAADGQNQITTLNTGLGDDTVHVQLTAASNDSFVLDTQGAYESTVALPQSYFAGDYNTAADQITVTLTDSTGTRTLEPYEYTLIPSLNAIALTITPVAGATVTVTDVRSTTSASFPVITGTGPLVLTKTTATTSRTVTYTGTPTGRDDDFVDGSQSTVPLVVFGGEANDTIVGGSANDILVGDRATIDFVDNPGAVQFAVAPNDETPSFDSSLGTIEAIRGGGGGGGDETISWIPSSFVVQSTYAGDNQDGKDTLVGNGGSDILIGGLNDDFEYGDAAPATLLASLAAAGHVLDKAFTPGASDNDVLVGDDGAVLAPNGTPSAVTSTEPQVGGHDTLDGADGSDVVIGGGNSDTITASLGGDIILGDSGFVDLHGNVESIAPE